jgi:plasmid stabilization system protein ParE
VRIEFTRRALQEIDRNARWWREHRPPARTLFEEELAAALSQIRTVPGLGQLYRVVRGRQQRRVLMPKTLHHVY